MEYKELEKNPYNKNFLENINKINHDQMKTSNLDIVENLLNYYINPIKDINNIGNSIFKLNLIKIRKTRRK